MLSRRRPTLTLTKTEKKEAAMAARYVWASFYTVGATRPRLSMQLRWWDADALCRDPRFAHSNASGSYNDWSARLDEAAFRELYERFLPDALTGLYAGSGWRERIAPERQILEGALAGGLGALDHIEVGVHEWESGY